MPNYQFAFPINNAVFKDKDFSFKVADVSFVTKSHLSKELFSSNEHKPQFSDNQIFAVVVVNANGTYDKNQNLAYEKCCFATDIFKICSDLYHSNFCNPKKWQFDLNNDFVIQGRSYFLCKEFDLDGQETFHEHFHADRYNAYIDTKILESVTKWNISDFELLYRLFYSADAKSIHKVLKRACHTYSHSFSINNLYERIVLLCTVLDTLATNEREGKVPQLQKYLPPLVLINDRLSEDLRNFIDDIYKIRSSYIHNAEEKNVSEKDVDKLEKIVYRVILQIVRNSTKYPSTKEICAAIDKGKFVPIKDNLPDIYIPKTQHMPCLHNNIDCPCTKENCPRHGHCCECVAHHKKSGTKLPACLRGIEWGN